MFNQVLGAAIGTKCTPSYACLIISFKEEEALFRVQLPIYFTLEDIQTIKLYFKRYMDDGFLLWSSF